MSVSSSVDDQGPVHSNGVGSYSMKIPQVDGPEECSILDRTAIAHSHHSRRLFWPQSSLKKASHEKDPTGIHCHALSPTTCIIALCSGRSMNSEARYAEMRQLWGWQANDFLSSASWLHSSWTNALNIEHCHKRIDWCSRLISMFLICGGCSFTGTLALRGNFCLLNLQGTTHSHWKFMS